MSVQYPIFAFGKDDQSMRLIESEDRILYDVEAIDIENDEYVFWDATGSGVRIGVSVGRFRSKLESVTSCQASFPIQDAFKAVARSLELPESVPDGAPEDVWNHIQSEVRKSSQRTGHRGTH